MAEKKTTTTVKTKAASTTLKAAKKVVEKTAKAAAAVKPAAVGKEQVKPTSLTADVYGVNGTVTGSITLSEAVFAAAINKQLLAQAVRVYLANQREGSAHTKTRGEVDGSTRKIYKQKGTGNARHGSIRAPIFVGGGNVFGPRVKDYSLTMPKKMKVRALASAFTQQYQNGAVRILAGFTGLEEKTNAYAKLLRLLSLNARILVVVSANEMPSQKYIRNIPGVSVLRAQDAYAYAVVSSSSVLITEAALAEIQQP